MIYGTARPSGGINTRSHRFWSGSGAVYTDGRRAQRLVFNFWCKKLVLSSLLFINPTVAAILELECNVTERNKENWVSAEFSERPLLASLRLIAQQSGSFGWINRNYCAFKIVWVMLRRKLLFWSFIRVAVNLIAWLSSSLSSSKLIIIFFCVCLKHFG